MCMSRGTTWSLGEIQMRHSCILKSRSSAGLRVSRRLFLLLFSELSMSQLDNLKAFDPFADASKGDEESGQEGVVHIR